MLYFQFFIAGIPATPTPPDPVVESDVQSGTDTRPVLWQFARAVAVDTAETAWTSFPPVPVVERIAPEAGQPKTTKPLPVWEALPPRPTLYAIAAPACLDGPAWSIPGPVVPACSVAATPAARTDIGFAKLRRSRLAKLEEAALTVAGFQDPTGTLMALHAVLAKPDSWMDADVRLTRPIMDVVRDLLRERP